MATISELDFRECHHRFELSDPLQSECQELAA